MEESILNDIKKMLGITEDYDVFDTDIMVHINGAIGILNQLGIGVEGFFLSTATQTWKDLLGEKELGFQNVKQYIYLKTKVVFDPPTSGFALDSMQALIKETEWRLNALYEVETKKKEESGCDCNALTPDQMHSLIDLIDGGDDEP